MAKIHVYIYINYIILPFHIIIIHKKSQQIARNSTKNSQTVTCFCMKMRFLYIRSVFRQITCRSPLNIYCLRRELDTLEKSRLLSQHLQSRHLQRQHLQSQHLQSQHLQSQRLQRQHLQSRHLQSQRYIKEIKPNLVKDKSTPSCLCEA